MKLFTLISFVIILSIAGCKTNIGYNKIVKTSDVIYYQDSINKRFVGINEVRKKIWFGSFSEFDENYLSLLYSELSYEEVKVDFGVLLKDTIDLFFVNPVLENNCLISEGDSTLLIQGLNYVDGSHLFENIEKEFNCYNNLFIFYKNECFIYLLTIPELLKKKIIINQGDCPSLDSELEENIIISKKNENIIQFGNVGGNNKDVLE